MKDLDADGSGEVDLDEFMQYFKDQQDQVRYSTRALMRPRKYILRVLLLI